MESEVRIVMIQKLKSHIDMPASLLYFASGSAWIHFRFLGISLMRKSLLLFILLISPSFIMACNGSGSYSSYPVLHLGTWSGEDSANITGVVTFREDGTGTMEYNNTTYAFRYQFDYSRTPIWLDLLYSREGKPFQARLIVKYPDENHLQWFTFFNDVRPADFPDGESGNVMTLTRVNPLTFSRSKSV